MATKIDLKTGARITQDKNGYRSVRVAHVSNVSGNKQNLLFNAISDPGLPVYGDPDPVVPGITLQTKVGEALSGGTYRVILTYFKDAASGGVDDATARVTGATASEQVNTDAAGNRRVTRWSSAANLREYTFEVTVERPRVSFDFSRMRDRFPKDLIDNYLGRINSRPWNGYPSRTILCTAINADEQGEQWQVRQSFSLNLATWDFVGAIPTTGAALRAHTTDPDPLLDLETGLRPFQIYQLADFTPLGLVL